MQPTFARGSRAPVVALAIAALIALFALFALAPSGVDRAVAKPDKANGAVSCDSHKMGTIPKNRISLQLFDFLVPIIGGFPPPNPPLTTEQTQENVRDVLAAIQEMGYTRIENFGGYWGWTPKQYRRVLREYGIRAVADHGSLDPATFETRLGEARTLGLQYIGSGGWPPPGNMNTLANALAIAENLNELGAQAQSGGKHLWVYGHNHNLEFSTKLAYDVDGDGVTEMVPAIEVVILNTDPDLVTFEIDVHWAMVGLNLDQDAVIAFLEKYSDRITQLHVKGTAADGSITDVGGPNDITDWPAVFQAADNTRYYHYEYDLAPDPFASAESAYDYLRCVRF